MTCPVVEESERQGYNHRGSCRSRGSGVRDFQLSRYRERRWPKPLRRKHNLGLLPLVKRLHIHERRYLIKFFPWKFHLHVRHRSSVFTNLQELEIDNLGIRELVPKLRLDLGQFSPTLPSLTLRAPEGSCRQILYFIGLFQRLEDLKIFFEQGDSTDDSHGGRGYDPTPTPLFIPPLRGKLTMRFSSRVKLVHDMIRLFDGLRFHSMDLVNVDGTQLLLDACARTLEKLQSVQIFSEQLPLGGIEFQPTTT